MGKPVSREPRAMLIERPPPARLDPTVKALGFVTLLNDLSSEVAVRTLPLFLANVLGVRVGIIGLIEGLAESTATLLKLVSGVLSDRVGKKKALALWGYGLSGFTKPLLFFATGWPLVLVVRVLDRIGKGIRTAPRDVGGTGQVALTRENCQALVLLSVIPGIASVFVLARWVREGPRSARAQWSGVRLAWRGLDGRFRAYLVMLVIFTLGNSSDAFLMLRAQTLGFQPVEIFLLLAGFNLVIAVSSTPAGALSDRLGRRGLIVVGWVIYAVIYLGFAYASSAWHIWVLYLGYGLYYGAFQGAASALVADLVPAELRGTAYGLFNGAIGVAAFPASLLAGLLWDWYGPPAPFLAGGLLALVAAVGVLTVIPQSPR